MKEKEASEKRAETPWQKCASCGNMVNRQADPSNCPYCGASMPGK
jgi:rubrerythrin